ncbi:hypothetical protein JCGZ_20937 [Jatropha curcas]|uniref:Uncharacterized protein n=1 Tax=Jatropha curcas TaxID=180498 RepID=A0A067K541_JATCU|nr:hypothetical protein JCGZ_20937 [Jatropha curcas]
MSSYSPLSYSKGNGGASSTFLDTDQGSKMKDPLALPTGPIIRARATKLRAALNAFVQEQVTLELQDHSYGRCEIELEEAPLMLHEVCKEAAH